jgi:hypothetical protein
MELINLKGGRGENKQPILLFFDPPEQLIYRRDNSQLTDMGRKDGIQLEGLREPAQDGLLAGGEMAELERPAGRVEPVLEAQVEGGEPLPLPREGVAGRIRRHCELSRRPRLKDKVIIVGKTKKYLQIRISDADPDPGSDAFLTPEPRIRDT